MRAENVERIEMTVQRAAAAVFAAAVGFALFHLLAGLADQPGLGAFTAAAGVVAYLACSGVLNAVGGRPQPFQVRAFDIASIGAPEAPMASLTDGNFAPAADDALELDDILAQIGPDSRVVRLFDPSAMPTPGQPEARIDQHVDDDDPAAGLVDASQSLYDALDELRRSLR